MANQGPQINQSEKPTKDYRGSLVYRQEYGYKLITMSISIRTFGEQSRVISHAYDLDVEEEVEHFPSLSPFFTAVDVYHFPVTDGTNIELIISSHGGEHQARYTVHPTRVEEDSLYLWLDIVKSSESVEEHNIQPYHNSDCSFDR